jgi:Protein of unknown function (DUF4238)
LPARRHHYVPQFYLRGFCKEPDHPRLFVVDTDKRTPFYTNPANVAVELDFHTIDSPVHPPDIVESKLAELEGEISLGLARIRENRSLQNDDDRALLFTFIALLLIKNPGMRNRISDAVGKAEMYRSQMMARDPKVWEREMGRAKQEGSIESDSDSQTLRELVLKGAFKIGLSVPGHLSLEFSLLPEIIMLVAARKWLLFCTRDSETGFVTSDNPVTLTWFDQERAQYPPGLGLRTTQLIFPISNELATIGTFEYDARLIDADEDFVAKINGNTILLRNRQVYARDSDFQYQLKHHDKRMRGAELLEDACVLDREPGDSID